MSRGNWESHKLLFGEDTTLKPCPFCGAEPYVDSCDRIIDIGCDKCGYHRHFHGFVQDEIETDVVVSRYKDSSRKAYEWYDKDAYQKAAAGWNERQNRLDEICENYGLTPYGVEFALEQYQKVICEISHGMLSKLTYEADHVLEVAQERWCDTCDLKEAQEHIVRCKDCKHYAVEDHYGNFHGYEILAASDVPTCHRWGNDTVMVKPDGYCFLGEGR